MNAQSALQHPSACKASFRGTLGIEKRGSAEERGEGGHRMEKWRRRAAACPYPSWCLPSVLALVSIFLKDKVQNSNGRFVLPVSGPVPWGTEVPGLIRTFNSKGEEVKTAEFKHGGNYVPAAQEGSFELYGDRVLKLGTNMYSVNPPAEAKTSTASDSAASRTPESIAPNPLAKEELNLLARLMGGMEIKTPSGPEPGFRLNLFTTDEEEEQAALASQEEPSCEVIDIQATQDPQRGEELARIMGEFEITDEPRRSTSKGDDLLAMMDEL